MVQYKQIQWHPFLAKGFELSVGRRGVLVLAEVEVSRTPPKADILLLRRETEQWTLEQLEFLPDGIRNTAAKHVLIEFKYSESLTVDGVIQALSYAYFYRKSNGLSKDEVKMFILCAKTPSVKRLQAFGYTISDLPGVIHSSHPLTQHVPLIVLNELSEESYNAFVKTFASRQTQKEKAFSLLRQFKTLSDELLTYFEALRVIWALPEEAMMTEILTPDRVLELGEAWKHLLLRELPEDKLKELLETEYKQVLFDQGREEGREEGERQRNIEIVHNMVAKGYELAAIADVTGLSEDQIQVILREKL